MRRKVSGKKMNNPNGNEDWPEGISNFFRLQTTVGKLSGTWWGRGHVPTYTSSSTVEPGEVEPKYHSPPSSQRPFTKG